MHLLQGSTKIQVVVALIAAIGALVVAGVQYFAQKKNSQLIEELRARLDRENATQSEYLKAYLDRLIDGKTQQLTAFKAVLEHVQLLRDAIRRFLSDPKAYSRDLISKEIVARAEEVLSAYSSNQVHFDANDRLTAHEIKNKCSEVAVYFRLYASAQQEEEVRRLITEIALDEKTVAELQNKLRNGAYRSNTALIDSLKQESSKGSRKGS